MITSRIFWWHCFSNPNGNVFATSQRGRRLLYVIPGRMHCSETLYSISTSARASNAGTTLSPSALALVADVRFNYIGMNGSNKSGGVPV